MLETAIGDGAKKLGLQEKVAETRRVDANIGALLVDILCGRSRVGLLAIGGRASGLVVELVIRVVDQILFGRHGDWIQSWRLGDATVAGRKNKKEMLVTTRKRKLDQIGTLVEEAKQVDEENHATARKRMMERRLARR